MPKRPDTHETVLLALELLRGIRRNRKVSAPELHRQLVEMGVARDLRTIQRQMDMLSEHESLLRTLAEQHARNLLPASLMKSDKGYDAAEFIGALTAMQVLPHVAQNTSNRKSAVPDSVASSEGSAISQQKCKLIEQGFGRGKLIGPIRQVMVHGLKKVDQMFVLTMAAYTLTRMRTLEQIRQSAA